MSLRFGDLTERRITTLGNFFFLENELKMGSSELGDSRERKIPGKGGVVLTPEPLCDFTSETHADLVAWRPEAVRPTAKLQDGQSTADSAT